MTVTRHRNRTRALTALLAVPAALALSACSSGPDVTAARVQSSVGPAFQHLYQDRLPLLPHVKATGVTYDPTCKRTTPGTNDVGPGADWVCLVSYVDETGQKQDGKIEVQVHSNSCWTAGASSKLVGTNTLTDSTGKVVDNPVFEFDGCFDPYV